MHVGPENMTMGCPNPVQEVCAISCVQEVYKKAPHIIKQCASVHVGSENIEPWDVPT